MKDLIKKLFDKQANEMLRKTTISKWDNLLTGVNENLYKRKLLTEKCTASYDGILPLARIVVAQTIGLDLVPVQPMSAPTGLLTYLDYNPESENLYKRKLLVEIYKKPKKPYRPSYLGGRTRFVSPGIYTKEQDYTLLSYDLVADCSISGATIGVSSRGVGSVSRKVTGPTNKPERIETKKEFMKIFGNT